jgi:protein-S-isoprenylcysteine O-methyltransferase Ste14
MTPAAGQTGLRRALVRLRVPLGFACAAASFWLATPTPRSLLVGLAIMLPGEALRVWAAGHIDKGREITSSGPYRFTRHPLYLGSTMLGVGLAVAARHAIVAVIVAGYLALTLSAAVRTEEAALDARFDGAYSKYRDGTLPAAGRRFSLSRVVANREHRAVIGLVLAGAILLARMRPW